MPSTPDPEPLQGPGADGPDRSEGAYPRQPEEAGFWAVPGVDPPRSATPARAPGSSGVEGYRPVAGQRVDAVVEQVRKIGDPGELIAIMFAAKTMLGAQVLGDLGVIAGRGEALDHIVGLLNVKSTVDALVPALLNAASQAGTVQRVAHSTAGAWVSLVGRLTSRQTSALVLGGRDAAPLRQVVAAGVDGSVNQFQAAAISGVMGDLPGDLEPSQVAEAESLLVSLAGTLASDGLARAAEEVLERVAPEAAQRAAEDKAARALERAERKRFFDVRHNGDGTSTLRGLLPVAEGELVRAVVDAAADKARRQTKDAPGAPLVERRQARADALVGLCKHAQGCRRAAALGAAGARVVVTIDAADLPDGTNARVEGTGERLDPAVFARLACDSDVMRVVLGAKGEVLDIGRATRAIPRGLRAAVVARDRGCSFPGCDRPPEVCECHHVVPWKQGGDTKLSNLCLLCPAHHRLVEPPKGRDPDWVLGLREDGLWEFRPPAWYDPERTPLMHHRHRKPPHPAATEASADGPAGDGADGRESGGSGRREDGDQPGDPPNDS